MINVLPICRSFLLLYHSMISMVNMTGTLRQLQREQTNEYNGFHNFTSYIMHGYAANFSVVN